jgi:hypothetical protein
MSLPLKLTTTIGKISTVPNHTNSKIINDFHDYMKSIGCSEHHHNNNLKAAIALAKFVGSNVTFF